MSLRQGFGRARFYRTVDYDPALLTKAEFCAGGRLWFPASPWHKNSFLYDSSIITQRLLRGSPDGKDYTISRAYMEFSNTGAPVDPVPTIDRAGNLSGYYNSLSAPRDYLRVPVRLSYEENTNDSLYTAGNKAVFLVESFASVGFKNGLTFSDTVGSVVYGGALVAAPGGDSDASQDLVFSRIYYSNTAHQQEKLPSSEISLRWELTFD